jgi:hypothetical protein
MDKAEEFINIEDTIRAFTDQSQQGSNNLLDKKKKEPPLSEKHIWARLNLGGLRTDTDLNSQGRGCP